MLFFFPTKEQEVVFKRVVEGPRGMLVIQKECFSFINLALTDSYYCLCIFRLECPFDTAVELAAFSLQGK